MKEKMTVYTSDGSIAFVFYSIRREGNKIIVDGKALDAIRMDMVLTFEEMLKGLRMALCQGIVLFILLLPLFTSQFLLHKALRKLGREA
ncbi:hypothetical protein ACFLTN_05875 [Chloroflexota bacterium]